MTIRDMKPGDAAWTWEGATFPDAEGQWWLQPGSYLQRHPADLTLRWNRIELMWVERLENGSYRITMSEQRHALNSKQPLDISVKQRALPTEIEVVPQRRWFLASLRLGNAGPRNRTVRTVKSGPSSSARHLQ